MRRLYVHILASRSHRLYAGVTGNLETRVRQHRSGEVELTSKYRINRLAYYGQIGPPIVAIEREKQIKGWLRAKKIALIESVNPRWNDLADEWFANEATADPSRFAQDDQGRRSFASLRMTLLTLAASARRATRTAA
ncbi:MAG: GIY-YIG nuclease family protein [Gemmatimonadaceae bacterium]